MADLQEFIRDITVDKKQYCIVCFRTESERKLVAPVALADFIKICRLSKLSKKESVCIYCERQAEVALNLYKTLSYARHVNQILWTLVDKKMSPRGIAYILPSKVRGQSAGPGSVKRNKLLSVLRRYQTFAQTDVLIVDATVPNGTTETNSDVSIVIEDDDERPPAAPRLVPIEKLLENPQSKPSPAELDNVAALSDVNPGSLVLYPVKTSNTSENQFLIIPQGANVQIDGNALNVVNSAPSIPLLLPNGNIVAIQPQNSNQFVLPITENIVQNQSIILKKNVMSLSQVNTVEETIMWESRKIGAKISTNVVPLNQKKNATQCASTNTNTIYVQSNVQQNNTNIQFVPSNTISYPNVKQQVTVQGQKASDPIGRGPMCEVRKVQSDPICQIADCRSEKVSGSVEMCQISDLRSLQQEDAEENVPVAKPPEPQKKSDPNIDWEDKIPMDVISFMDANDPNAPDIIPPPPAPPAPLTPPAPPTRPPAPTTYPPAPPSRHTAPPARPSAPPTRPLGPRSAPSPAQRAKVLNGTPELLTPLKRRRSVRNKKCDDDDDLIVIN